MLLDKVVIGSTLESILFAFSTGAHFLTSDPVQPFFFENLKTYKILGSSKKKEIYDKFQTFLGLTGKSLYYHNIKNIRIHKEKISVFGQSLLSEFKFNKCFICNPEKVSFENSIIKAGPTVFKVVDDFKVSRIPRGTDNIPSYASKEKFVSNVFFYNSLRVDGAKRVTDAIALSELTKEQLHDVEFSDTMVMFKLRKIMKEMGYEGLVENIKYKNGKNRIKKLILEHVQRIIVEIDNNKYQNSERVKFIKPTIKDFFDGYPTYK